MILDKVREFIENECPLLSGKKVKANFLGEVPKSYTIDNVPSDEIIKKYPDGGCLMQFNFVFASRENYDAELSESLEISRFYEDFSNWVYMANSKGNLPVLDAGLKPISLEVTSCGHLFSRDSESARYQIRLRLIYEKEGVFNL